MSTYTAHVDTFARDNLPPKDQWPDFINLDKLGYPDKINAAAELLDKAVAEGFGDKVFIYNIDGDHWTYQQLLDKANQIAHVLTDDLGLKTGERVMLSSPNNAMMAACWFGIVKAGGIAVATMSLLRGHELAVIADKAEVRLALCDDRLKKEVDAAEGESKCLEKVVAYGAGELEGLMEAKPTTFDNVETAADDVVLIAFTSGTTGVPKGCMHFHRDVLAICDTFNKQVLKPAQDEIFIGSPPLAFTFGLGGLLLFPMHARASVVMLEAGSPDNLAKAIHDFKATTSFTAPTAYRAILAKMDEYDLSSLSKCVSAGETLPKATYDAWLEATGLKMIDGIGATEMLHIFISAAGDDIRPGATGKPVPLYEARVIDENNQPLPAGEIGRLAVRGPTGCRYLADERQKKYVVDGWNVTGDAYMMDEEGYFWFQSRADDMIISSGYNIAGPEVEDALMTHAAVKECAVVGSPDDERGMVVKAFIVLADGHSASPELTKTLQDHVKAKIAPYKYPRAIDFVDTLPKTGTGKIQRFKLRQQEMEKA